MLLWCHQSEQAVIGAILYEPECVTDVLALVSPGDFFMQDHRDCMETIEMLHAESEPVDLVTVSSRCPKHSSYLGDLAVKVPSAANVRAYAGTVRDYSRRRSIIGACQKTIESAERSSADEMAAEIIGQIEEAGERAIGSSLSFQEVLRATADAIAEASEGRKKGVIGVPTGMPLLDKATAGLCPRRLIALAARPSIGKTALANQIALHAASRGFPIGVCSLEMGEEELGARSMSNRFGINFTRLLRGDSAAVEGALTGLRTHQIDQWPIHIDTSTYTLSGIEARISSWVRKYGIQAAFVDHIGLVEVDSNLKAVERLGIVSRRLKKLAKRLNIAVVAVCQLNRGNEREGRKPRLSDLRDSGNIEQDVDVAMFLHADPDNVGEREIEIAFGFLKNRTGRRGWLPEKVVFDGATQTFLEISERWGGNDAD